MVSARIHIDRLGTLLQCLVVEGEERRGECEHTRIIACGKLASQPTSQPAISHCTYTQLYTKQIPTYLPHSTPISTAPPTSQTIPTTTTPHIPSSHPIPSHHHPAPYIHTFHNPPLSVRHHNPTQCDAMRSISPTCRPWPLIGLPGPAFRPPCPGMQVGPAVGSGG